MQGIFLDADNCVHLGIINAYRTSPLPGKPPLANILFLISKPAGYKTLDIDAHRLFYVFASFTINTFFSHWSTMVMFFRGIRYSYFPKMSKKVITKDLVHLSNLKLGTSVIGDYIVGALKIDGYPRIGNVFRTTEL